jgi:hypothetical protein
MVWSALRYILIAVSIMGAILFVYFSVRQPPPRGDEWAYLFPLFLFLNALYLICGNDAPGGRGGQPSRLRRMATLWLDAKEAELRKRANEGSN